MVSKSRPTFADIDLSAYQHNHQLAGQLAGEGVRLMSVIKANGYGHGAVPLARAAVSIGVDCFGVATVDEGLELRQAGIKGDILVLDGIPPGAEDDSLENGFSGVIFDLASARRLAEKAGRRGKNFPVHIKVDSGMGRLGFMPTEMEEALWILSKMTNIEVEGLMTHYARADEPDAAPTMKQVALFEKTLKIVDGSGIKPTWIHAANSAALLLGRGPMYNMVRPGIMLYGSNPTSFSGTPEDYTLRPVLTLKSEIIQLKTVPKGWAISYGGRYVAPEPRKVAILPIGYADGFMRYNSLGSPVLVRGQRVPVLGVVCMDLTIIDVTGVEGAGVGDEVVLLGKQGEERITAEEVAARGKTISYEVFCNLTARVPRRYHP
jgi:alanine racemase